MSESLKLRATDVDDLSVVSTVLQDGLIMFGDMGYIQEEKRFLVVVNRFRWENQTEPRPKSGVFERVHCGLCFEDVTSVHFRNLDRRNRSQVLELLAVKPEDGKVDLLFAGRGRVRLEVGGILCHLQDLDEPWPTRWRPRHQLADEE